MNRINLDGSVQKRIKIRSLYLMQVSVLVIACYFVVTAQGNLNSEIANYEKPDLVVESISWEPVSPKTRDEVTISIICANHGNAPTIKGFSVFLYMDDKLVKTKYLKPLDAGSSEYAPPIAWKVGEDVAEGIHTFSAYVNQDKSGGKNYIKESGNLNNRLSETFYVIKNLPDLKLVDISWDPVDISNGDLVTFTVDYSNIGHLSTDEKTAIWLYVDDELVTRKPYVGLLAPDESGSVEIYWTVDRGFKGGEHNIVAYIDRDKFNSNYKNLIKEEDEQNNMISKVLWTSRNESLADITVVVKDKTSSRPIEFAEMFVDNEYVGRTDSRGELTFDVTEGIKHTFKASRLGYISKEKEVKVNYDIKPPVMSLYLESVYAPITLSVNSESGVPIRNAEVSVEGDTIGATNINGDINFEGEKESSISVKIDKPGYYSEGPVEIPVSKYGAKKFISLKAVPKPDVNFYSTNNISKIGDNAIFILSVLNPLTSPEHVTVQLVIAPPSGISIYGSWVKNGGSLYHNTESLAPGEGTTIALEIVGNEVGTYIIPAKVYYYYANLEDEKLPELDAILELTVESNVESESEDRPTIAGFESMFFVTAMVIVFKAKLRRRTTRQAVGIVYKKSDK